MRWIWVTVFLLLPATAVHAGTLHGGVQAKFLGDLLGLWGELHLSERFYLHGSAGWLGLFLLGLDRVDLNVGPGVRLGKRLDVFVRFHWITVFGERETYSFLEPGVRLRLFRWLWLEGGVLASELEIDGVEVPIALPNVGLLVDLTAFFRREAD